MLCAKGGARARAAFLIRQSFVNRPRTRARAPPFAATRQPACGVPTHGYSAPRVEANLVDASPLSGRPVGIPGRFYRLWPWLPLPVGAAYLVLLLAKFNQIVAATYLNADAASAPVVGELFGGSPAHRQVFLGQMGWFSTLLFELATRSLPAHRQLWETVPYAMALASVAMIAWAAFRVAGRWAAAIAGVAILCAGPHTLGLLFSLNDHSTTWFALALLAALLVFFEAPPTWLKASLAAPIALVAGAIVGVNAASDLTLMVAGIVPIVFAAGLAWVLRPGQARASAWWWIAGTVVVAVVFDVLTHAWAHHENVLTPPQYAHNTFAAAEAIPTNFKLWWQSLMVLGNGNFFGGTLDFASGLQLLCAVLTLVALALVTRFAWRALLACAPQSWRSNQAHIESTPRSEPSLAPPLSPERAPQSSVASLRRESQALPIAWCAFWASSAILLSASFIFSSNPIDINSSRYLVGVIYAVAALLPLLATSGIVARVAVTAGVTVFALSGLVSLFENEEIATGATPSYSLIHQVERYLGRRGLNLGYANYWDGAPIMWSSHFHIRAYPVQDCAPNLCWSYLHMITSWYTTPRPHRRSFLISDATQAVPSAPTPNLGKPTAIQQIGPLTVYVYPYDIASRMTP
jgi:hypothetical protein